MRYTILSALSWLLRAIYTLLLVRVIGSWLPAIRQTKFYDVLIQLTEPIVAPVRALLRKLNIRSGMFDFSILGAFLIIYLLQIIVARLY